MSTKNRFAELRFGLVITATILGMVKPVLAQLATVGGASFSLPATLVPQGGRPTPVVFSRRNADGTLSLDVLTVAYPNGDANRAANEYRDWQGAGQAIATGFGNANARTLEQAYNAKCSHKGSPVAHDLRRMALEIQVETICATVPEPTALRSLVFQVLTKSKQVLIRVDAKPAAYAEAEAMAKEIWRTLKVEQSQRLTISGLRFTDYRLVRPEALAGEFFGTILAAVAFGMFLTALLLWTGLKPLPSLAAAQVLLLLLRFWLNERDGVWELNWLVDFPSAILAIVLLRKWAGRRWERRKAKGTDATVAP